MTGCAPDSAQTGPGSPARRDVDGMPLLRPAGPFDAPLLAALHAACFPGEPWDEAAMATLLASPGVSGLIAARGPADMPVPLGLILYRLVADQAEVLAIAVLPAARAGGVGRALLDGFFAQAQAAGVADIFLEVAEDNLAARILYERTGFKAVGRRAGYYRRKDGTVAALVLGKRFTV